VSEVTPPETTAAAAAPVPDPEAAPRQTTPFLVLQFFIFPMAIVAVCVTVFVVFGLISSDGRGARDYLAEVRSGSANRRWQAAFELSKVLQAKKDPVLADPRFISELVAAYEASADDDPRVRRYLALALGRLGERQAVPALRKGLGDTRDSEGLLFSIWALGVIADPQAVPELVALTRHDDAGIRKTAVHALGAFDNDEAREALREALKDGTEDVRWNAALALGRHNDPAAAGVLGQMLDRAHLESVSGLSPEQREDVILEAVRSASTTPDPSLVPGLEKLRDGDPNLKIREAARLALERKAQSQ
jgi:HEAT repeat protein